VPSNEVIVKHPRTLIAEDKAFINIRDRPLSPAGRTAAAGAKPAEVVRPRSARSDDSGFAVDEPVACACHHYAVGADKLDVPVPKCFGVVKGSFQSSCRCITGP
jgi:hypothetical protein